MAKCYRKNFKRKFRRYKRRGSNKIWRAIQSLKPERKYLSGNEGVPGTGTGFNNASNISFALNTMSRGVADGERIGTEATMKFIEVRGRIFQSGSIGTTAVRVVLFVDRSPRGQARRLFGNSPPNSTTAIYDYESRNQSQFQILSDRTYQLTSVNTYAFNFTFKHKLNLKTDYSRGDTGTIGDIENNAIRLIIFTDYGGATTNLFYWFNYNIAYTDA